jgi:hypothetical protein
MNHKYYINDNNDKIFPLFGFERIYVDCITKTDSQWVVVIEYLKPIERKILDSFPDEKSAKLCLMNIYAKIDD